MVFECVFYIAHDLVFDSAWLCGFSISHDLLLGSVVESTLVELQPPEREEPSSQHLREDDLQDRWMPLNNFPIGEKRSDVSEDGVAERAMQLAVDKRRMRLSRRRRPSCDTNNVSAAMILEFLRTGRMCGRRMSRFRYGLSGR